ncbi:MAG: manganese efflux pump MntP family protein [Lachnospiraceae bacterium]|nr:manganese efflux pump MntP family protein [Lachnospiraceae bacterium]
MSFFELTLIAVGLAMDAFAVSICRGLAMKEFDKKLAFTLATFFGGFQALMPLLGWVLGSQFTSMIQQFDHWIAFILLALIGFQMLKEGLSHEEEEIKAVISLKEIFMLAVATSIDALAVGVTFSFLKVSILEAIGVIGVITFFISLIGVKIGNVFGMRYKQRAEIFGGFVLISIGLKVLIEHLFF